MDSPYKVVEMHQSCNGASNYEREINVIYSEGYEYVNVIVTPERTGLYLIFKKRQGFEKDGR
jgi:hypothetical protein